MLGVQGSFICDGDGLILASKSKGDYQSDRLNDVSTLLIDTLKNLTSISGRESIELDLVYEEERFLVRKLVDGCLCILCSREINLPVLYTTVDQAINRLGR